jgi:uncharacterized membrane protein YhaH (DUF805 family)
MNELKMYFLDVIKNKYAAFDGRARRAEYWYFALFANIVSIPLYCIDEYLQLAFSVIIAIPSLGLAIRRLHDINKSGWYYFLIFIPIIGAILLLIWSCKEGTHGPNQYGEDPKAQLEFPTAE